MQPLVSIIIPVYNSEDFLAETIQCALNQTYPNKEIIIIDDGSTDNSNQIALSFQHSKNIKVLRQENKGGSAARNKGLELAQGEYIQFLDSDDLMASNKIELQMQQLKDNKKNSVHCSWIKFVHNINEPIQTNINFSINYDCSPIEWLTSNQMSNTHCWISSRNLIEKAGGWNEELLINQDGEFFSRVAASSEKILFNHEARVYYRLNRQNSITTKLQDRKIILSRFRSFELFEKLLLSLENSEKIRLAIANKYLKFIYDHYPREKDLLASAEEKVKVYGGGNLRPPLRSIWRLMSNITGWKAAKRLHFFYNSLLN